MDDCHVSKHLGSRNKSAPRFDDVAASHWSRPCGVCYGTVVASMEEAQWVNHIPSKL